MSKKEPRLRLRIEFDGEHTLGPGKIQLLGAVVEHGSISAAARSMEMSYRHAWEMLDDVNRCFAGRVIEAEAGGRAGGGARVTAFGRELIARFNEISATATKAVEAEMHALERSRAPARRSPKTRSEETEKRRSSRSR